MQPHIEFDSHVDQKAVKSGRCCGDSVERIQFGPAGDQCDDFFIAAQGLRHVVSEACHASTGAQPDLDVACEVAVAETIYSVDIFLRQECNRVSRLALEILDTRQSSRACPKRLALGRPSRALPLRTRIGCRADLDMKLQRAMSCLILAALAGSR